MMMWWKVSFWLVEKEGRKDGRIGVLGEGEV